MEKRILVTGATGKVGHRLVRSLQRRGLPVRAAVHSAEHATGLAGVDTEVVPFDFDDPASIAAALEGVHTVALLTPPDARQVDWAIRTIDLARAAGVKRVVRMSVLAAAMEPGITLGRWHRTVERYLLGTDLDWTIVRPGPFMQNFLGMYPRLEGRLALPIDGQAPVNHIHVADVAEALAAVLAGEGHTGHTYMVTGPGPMGLADAATLLSDASGAPIDFRTVTPDEAREAWLGAGLPPWFASILLELFAAFGTGAVGLRTSTFEDLTGLQPRSFADFAEEVAGRAAA